MSLFERLKRSSAFVRGILGAIAFLGVAPHFLPYTALEIFAFVNAVIVEWNAIMSGFWNVISGLIPLPELPPEFISAIVLGMSLSSVWTYSILNREWAQQIGFFQSAAFAVRLAIAFIEVPLIMATVLIAYPHPVFWICLLAAISILITSLARLPRVRFGFLFTLGFICVLQAAYFLSTPETRAVFDNFVCRTQNVGLPQCANAVNP